MNPSETSRQVKGGLRVGCCSMISILLGVSDGDGDVSCLPHFLPGNLEKAELIGAALLQVWSFRCPSHIPSA